MGAAYYCQFCDPAASFPKRLPSEHVYVSLGRRTLLNVTKRTRLKSLMRAASAALSR